MRILYFDIDGTLLHGRTGLVKVRLGAGRFEAAVRDLGIDRLCCIGNLATVIHALREFGQEPQMVLMILQSCDGAFEDPDWLAERLSIVEDPGDRASHVDATQDWWLVDDLARYYFEHAHRTDLLEKELGHRTLIPDPEGDGEDVMQWLGSIPLPRSSSR